MSLPVNVYRFVVSNSLTVYYNILILGYMFVNYLKKPFAVNSVQHKTNVVRPSSLYDPKYGVHRYINVNDIKLHYVESGDISKPLVIFLHGFPEFWYSWRYQILHFKKNYWCIALDMRGYGDSEKPKGVASYKKDVIVKDIRQLIEKLGRDKCILMAHDWGGAIAARFRDIYPDALLAVIILASCSLEALIHEIWNNPTQRLQSWYMFFYKAPLIPEFFIFNDLTKMLREALLVKGKNTVTESDVDCFAFWFRKQSDLTPPINYYRANLDHYLQPTPQCKRNIPFLAALAANDPYLNHSLLVFMKKQYKYIETAIVDDCGHFLQQEEPETVNQLIGVFLEKHNI